MLTAFVIKKILAGILSLMISLGVITAPSTADPITFKNSEEVQLSFVAVSDIHIFDDSFTSYNFNRLFEDVGNSSESIDAIVMAGDLVENGLTDEYNAFFKVLDEETVIPHRILASGNHDMRYYFNKNSKIIRNKVEEYLNIDTNGKNYYSYDLNGYTFIVMGTEKRILEKAYISDEQLAFLDSELARATANGDPAFVVCHQPLANTHGLPEVWKTGDLGDQSEQVRAILTKYENVFFINGHLHDGIYERSVEKLADDVYSINLPTYGKNNDYGEYKNQKWLGFVVEVYGDEVIFNARDFRNGETLNTTYTFDIAA